MIGKFILNNKILEKLGEGGMGVVYLAEDTKINRREAMNFCPIISREILMNVNVLKLNPKLSWHYNIPILPRLIPTQKGKD